MGAKQAKRQWSKRKTADNKPAAIWREAKSIATARPHRGAERSAREEGKARGIAAAWEKLWKTVNKQLVTLNNVNKVILFS